MLVTAIIGFATELLVDYSKPTKSQTAGIHPSEVYSIRIEGIVDRENYSELKEMLHKYMNVKGIQIVGNVE
jgi:hypothetical protein